MINYQQQRASAQKKANIAKISKVTLQQKRFSQNYRNYNLPSITQQNQSLSSVYSTNMNQHQNKNDLNGSDRKKKYAPTTPIILPSTPIQMNQENKIKKKEVVPYIIRLNK